jgi:hypothetical protein
MSIALVEAKFGSLFFGREYEAAAKLLEREERLFFGDSTTLGAWYLMWRGYCLELIGDLESAHACYRRAHRSAKEVPQFGVATPASEGAFSAQVSEVAQYLYGQPKINDLALRTFDADVAALDGEHSVPQTEEAMRILGTFLGLASSRPDKEHDTGPDVLWYLPEDNAWSMELKTDKEAQGVYFKKDVMQVSDHIQWVIDNTDATGILPAFLGPEMQAHRQANPRPDAVVFDLEAMREIRDRLKAALEDIISQALPMTLKQTVYDVFKRRGLLWNDLYHSTPRVLLKELR